MRYGGYGDDFEDEKEPKPWWPSQWPLWVWNIFFVIFAAFIVLTNKEPLNALFNIVMTWAIIFGGYLLYKQVLKRYYNFYARQELDEQRKQDEYHGLSAEENKIWDDLKNKLNEK